MSARRARRLRRTIWVTASALLLGLLVATTTGAALPIAAFLLWIIAGELWIAASQTRPVVPTPTASEHLARQLHPSSRADLRIVRGDSWAS